LSQPESHAGRRLKSERELAGLLHLDRYTMRSVLDELVDEGLLTRRHGSGTFVRRVLGKSSINGLISLAEADEYANMSTQQLARELGVPERDWSTKSIFAPMRRIEREVAERTQQRADQLQIGLWSNLAEFVHPHQLVMAGIIERINELGHHVSLFTLAHLINEGYDAETQYMEMRLSTHRCDGHMVLDIWADQFLQACAGSPVPYLFFGIGTTFCQHQPTVYWDTLLCMHQAFAKLAQCGCQRVAMLTLNKRDDHAQMERDVFRGAVTESGIADCAFHALKPDLPGVMKVVDDYLLDTSPNRLQGLYVADDHLMPAVAESFRRLGQTPGKDMAVVILSNKGTSLPQGIQWSRMEFDPRTFGRFLVDSLLRRIALANEPPFSQAIQSCWIDGKTLPLDVNTSDTALAGQCAQNV
jgi:DNA-binding LacI/PurR family transcriptional regulator